MPLDLPSGHDIPYIHPTEVVSLFKVEKSRKPFTKTLSSSTIVFPGTEKISQELGDVGVIKNLNIQGENNDMVDFIDSVINNLQLEENILLQNVLVQIRNTIKNKNIYFTQIEQDWFIQNIQNLKEELNVEKRVNKILFLVEHSLNYERRESEYRDEMISVFEMMTNIQNIDFQSQAIVEDMFKGDTSKLVIIIPQAHKNSFDIEPDSTVVDFQKTIFNIQQLLYEAGVQNFIEENRFYGEIFFQESPLIVTDNEKGLEKQVVPEKIESTINILKEKIKNQAVVDTFLKML